MFWVLMELKSNDIPLSCMDACTFSWASMGMSLEMFSPALTKARGTFTETLSVDFPSFGSTCT